MIITKQQKEILEALNQVGPVSAKGLYCYLQARFDRNLWVKGSLEKSALYKRLRRLIKRGLVFSDYLDVSWEYSNRVAYELTRKGKKVLRDN